ncbi:MAG: CDP-diacylglycerol--glycerol-3-phosphate 3-phosphatidyltransferase [Candidatus Magasanikbacteria bacterium]|nr:CDP-diacylglycerol--glycerol-3-phosphate 3-phosphatidyltransferase [Candidatus Magasanikbacteria bacterium]|tara:strand:- start:857 stop:1480 length:624 start_codon:yes stop_codon:yes gene_type:complete
MIFIKRFIATNKPLFTFHKAEEIFLHDRFLYRFFLRVIPESITPNVITTIRVATTPIPFFLVLYGEYSIGAIVFLIVAFTDAVDGTLARVRSQVTRFGMLFDPLADKLLIGSMVILLVFQNFHYLLGVAILGIEILFIITALIAKIKFNSIFSANKWGKIKMALQVLAISFTLIALVFNTPHLLTFAFWCFGFAIGFALISLFSNGI